MIAYRNTIGHWSRWGIFFLFPICMSFVVTGILILLQRDQELASYLFGWFTLALMIPASVFVVISRIVILTGVGPAKKRIIVAHVPSIAARWQRAAVSAAEVK